MLTFIHIGLSTYWHYHTKADAHKVRFLVNWNRESLASGCVHAHGHIGPWAPAWICWHSERTKRGLSSCWTFHFAIENTWEWGLLNWWFFCPQMWLSPLRCFPSIQRKTIVNFPLQFSRKAPQSLFLIGSSRALPWKRTRQTGTLSI